PCRLRHPAPPRSGGLGFLRPALPAHGAQLPLVPGARRDCAGAGNGSGLGAHLRRLRALLRVCRRGHGSRPRSHVIDRVAALSALRQRGRGEDAQDTFDVSFLAQLASRPAGLCDRGGRGDPRRFAAVHQRAWAGRLRGALRLAGFVARLLGVGFAPRRHRAHRGGALRRRRVGGRRGADLPGAGGAAGRFGSARARGGRARARRSGDVLRVGADRRPFSPARPFGADPILGRLAVRRGVDCLLSPRWKGAAGVSAARTISTTPRRIGAQVPDRLHHVIPPEGVPIRFVVALAGDRVGAFILDILIIGAVLLVFWIPLAILAGMHFIPDDLVLAGLLLVTFLVRTFYFSFFEL